MTPGAPAKLASALYKYVGIDGLRRILDGSIRFTQPSAFNDPFELLPEIIVPNGTGAANQRVLRHSGGPPIRVRRRA